MKFTCKMHALAWSEGQRPKLPTTYNNGMRTDPATHKRPAKVIAPMIFNGKEYPAIRSNKAKYD